MKKMNRIALIASLLANAATRWAAFTQSTVRSLSHRCSIYTRSRRGKPGGKSEGRCSGAGKTLRRCTFGHNKVGDGNRSHQWGMVVLKAPALVGDRPGSRMVLLPGSVVFRRTPLIPVKKENGRWQPVVKGAIS